MLRILILRGRDCARVLVPLLFCLTFGPSVAHAAFANLNWTLKFSCKEMVLEDPDDPMAMKYSAWDTPTQRIADLNMPFLELTNESDSDGPITEFDMTIGDTRFHFSDVYFGDYVKLGDSTPGFDLNATTEDNEDFLKVQILNGGLMPGETVRFRVDIDVDPGHPDIFPHQDFRLVFFDMNGNDTSDNSIVSVIFSEGDMTETLMAQLPDFESDNDNYINNNIRPYSVMEGIDIFEIGGNQVIPEPSSLALLGLGGMVALMGWARRRK